MTSGADDPARATIPDGISRSPSGTVNDGPTVIVEQTPTDFVPPAPSKPPHVPFYDDDTVARRRRLEPTVEIRNPKSVRPPASAMLDGDGSKPSTFRWMGGMFVGVLLVAGTLAALVVAWRMFNTRTPVQSTPALTATVTPTVPTSAVPALAPITSVSSAPSAETAPAPAADAAGAEEIVVTIDTIPSHATVLVGGAKMGTTPSELKIARSDEPIDLEIRAPGYAISHERLVPNVNQRLKLTLVARPQPKASSQPYRKFE